ncbi:hypothetical protein RUM44_002687 [Polyplax serrata]|uniref:Uncharacterized protein n=1 Tax=Polyplax serrata TaxID=468196 RepID=A0ABR1AFG3_POLSC
MVDNKALDLSKLCRICSSDLQDKGVGIFSPECMENLVGEKIRRYLYFSRADILLNVEQRLGDTNGTSIEKKPNQFLSKDVQTFVLLPCVNSYKNSQSCKNQTQS